MRAINTNTKSRSISTGTPMDWRTWNKEDRTSAHIKHINMQLEAGVARSTTTFKMNGKAYEAIQCTDAPIQIYNGDGTEINATDVPDHVLDSLNKAHDLKQTDAQVTLDKMAGKYKKPPQQGYGEITLKLKHGNINTYSLVGPEIKIYKEVSKGTWTQLNAAIKEILEAAQADQWEPQCVSEGSQKAVDRVKNFVDDLNGASKETASNFRELEDAWNEISGDFRDDLERQRDELLMEEHEAAIKKADALLNE